MENIVEFEVEGHTGSSEPISIDRSEIIGFKKSKDGCILFYTKNMGHFQTSHRRDDFIKIMKGMTPSSVDCEKKFVQFLGENDLFVEALDIVKYRAKKFKVTEGLSDIVSKSEGIGAFQYLFMDMIKDGNRYERLNDEWINSFEDME